MMVLGPLEVYKKNFEKKFVFLLQKFFKCFSKSFLIKKKIFFQKFLKHCFCTSNGLRTIMTISEQFCLLKEPSRKNIYETHKKILQNFLNSDSKLVIMSHLGIMKNLKIGIPKISKIDFFVIFCFFGQKKNFLRNQLSQNSYQNLISLF